MAVNKRAEFDLIKKRQANAGKGKARMAQSTLIVAQEIVTNKTVYRFPVTLNDGAIVLPNEEIRLDINDEFTMYEQGFYLRGEISAVEDPSDKSPIWLTHVPFDDDSSYVGMQKFYNGRFNISVNNIVYMQNWDTKQHEYKPLTQVQNFSAGIPFSTWYANNFKENAMIDVLPTITFSGAKKNDLELQLPDSLTLGGPTVFIPTNVVAGNLSFKITHIIWVARGYLAQNSSTFQ